jgi:Asp-tRNA(Asn)/Glu-tRNA(Gln) amidotransferase A subunit family amidase
MGMLRQCIEWLESGEKTPEDLVAFCRRRIDERDPELRAWVEVSPQRPLGEGPLDGIPFAAKDTFETLGMSTAYGSAIYAGRKGACDAALVTRLRQAGAVLLGKTQTTAFASFDPSPTRNPHNPAHTPGGSSSG